jgi:glycosyltransferase involved in cell wall biosynthesis
MLSAVIATKESERVLLPTLSALVPGVAAGILRDVIIADGGSHDATEEIADGAGCRFLLAPGARGAQLKAAADVARGPWILFLRPGIVPDATWVAEVSRFIEESDLQGLNETRAAVFRPGSTSYARPLLVEALALLKSALGGRPRPEQGLLIHAALLGRLGGPNVGSDTPENDLFARLGRRRIVLLRSGALVSGKD